MNHIKDPNCYLCNREAYVTDICEYHANLNKSIGDNMIEVPMLKITLQSMEKSLLHAFSDYHNDIERLIKIGIERAIVSLPELISSKCQSAISSAIEEATYNATKDYFSHGGEGYALIYNSVRESFKK